MKTPLGRFTDSRKIELGRHLICTVSVTAVLVALGCLTHGASAGRYSAPLLMRATSPPNKWSFNDLTSEAFKVALWRPIQRPDKLTLLVFIHDLTGAQSASRIIPEKSVAVSICLQNYNFYKYEYGGSRSDYFRVLLLYGVYARFRKMPRRRFQNCQINTNRENKYPRVGKKISN